MELLQRLPLASRPGLPRSVTEGII